MRGPKACTYFRQWNKQNKRLKRIGMKFLTDPSPEHVFMIDKFTYYSMYRCIWIALTFLRWATPELHRCLQTRAYVFQEWSSNLFRSSCLDSKHPQTLESERVIGRGLNGSAQNLHRMAGRAKGSVFPLRVIVCSISHGMYVYKSSAVQIFVTINWCKTLLFAYIIIRYQVLEKAESDFLNDRNAKIIQTTYWTFPESHTQWKQPACTVGWTLETS